MHGSGIVAFWIYQICSFLEQIAFEFEKRNEIMRKSRKFSSVLALHFFEINLS
jgi:hypothetical protein